MEIRTYRPGDEAAQAHIYNVAAAALPGFKPATAEEIARRYRADDDPMSRFYAVEGDRVIGYATFSPSGRISYPWCLPDAPDRREPLLDALLAAMTRRGLGAAWAAYRADWGPILTFFEEHGFARERAMINYEAERERLPRTPIPEGLRIEPLAREDLPRVQALGRGLFAVKDAEALGAFYGENPDFEPSSLFALRREADGAILGAGLAIIDPKYADPTKLDAAMPCFRLGAFGTETERHKRVNGLVSVVGVTETAGEVLLAEAARRLAAAGLARAAAQAPSDRPDLCGLYDRYLRRQGAFPILR
ncbi:MAG: hypothetical protein IRY99_16245, partial [Isosphaeraceae bacterium]|nr:hypothetical protein [Isosphaeraceae bacterium]